MPNNKLILRTLNSPWTTPLPDIRKGSVLTHEDVDNNFIYLRGEIIFDVNVGSGSEAGNIVLHKINGDKLLVPFTADTNTFVTGGTYDNNTAIITLNRNDNNSVNINISSLKTYVDDSINNLTTDDINTGTTNFFVTDGDKGDIIISNSGQTWLIDPTSLIYTTGTTLIGNVIYFDRTDGLGQYNVDLTSIVTGITSQDTYTTGSTLIGNTVYFDRTDSLSAYTLDLSTLDVNDTFVTGGTINYNNEDGTITFTRNDGVTFTVSNVTDKVTTGATLVGSVLYFDRNDSLSAYTVDLSPLLDDTNFYVTGGTVVGSTLYLDRNDTLSAVTIDVSSLLDNTDNFTTGTTLVGSTLYFNRTNGLSAYTTDLTPLVNSLTLTNGNGITIGTGNTIDLGGALTQPITIISGSTTEILDIGGNLPNVNLGQVRINSTSYQGNHLTTYDGTGGGQFINISPGEFSSTNYISPVIRSQIINGSNSAQLWVSSNKIFRLYLDSSGGGIAPGSGESFTINGTTFTEGIDFTGQGNYLLDAATIAGLNYSAITYFDSVIDEGNGFVKFNFIFPAQVSETLTDGNFLLFNWESLIETSNSGVQIRVGDDAFYGTPSTILTISDTETIFTDNTPNQEGIKYAADYSATYTNRSLVDKEYVDNAITAADTYITGMTFNPGNYQVTATRNDGFTTAPIDLSILSADVNVTGGTYDINTGVVTFTNNSGGTFNVSGFTSGMTDTYTTGATLVGNTIQFDNNIYGNNFYNVDLTPLISPLTGSTFDYIDFNTGYTPTQQVGRIHWDQDYGTLDVDLEGNNINLKVGLDNLYYIKNQSGSAITKGSVVRASGTLGSSGRILGSLMIANGSVPYYYTLGIAGENIPNGEDGYVYEFGLLKGIDTTGTPYGETWVDGDILYVSSSISGGLTKVEPTEPNLKIQMALVIDADSNGSIFIRPDLGSNLGDLHNVQSTGQSEGDLISYKQIGGGYWEYTKDLNGSYTISGSLSATTISATTYYGDGSNLSGISSPNIYTSNGTIGTTRVATLTDTLSFSGGRVSFDTTTNGILLPRLTTAQMNAIASPATNTILYNTDLNGLYRYNGSAWVALSSGYGIIEVQSGTGTGQPTYFADLQSALETCKASGGYFTVKLYSNLTITSAIQIDYTGSGTGFAYLFRNLTIDFNGFSITNAQANTTDAFTIKLSNSASVYQEIKFLNGNVFRSNGTGTHHALKCDETGRFGIVKMSNMYWYCQNGQTARIGLGLSTAVDADRVCDLGNSTFISNASGARTMTLPNAATTVTNFKVYHTGASDALYMDTGRAHNFYAENTSTGKAILAVGSNFIISQFDCKSNSGIALDLNGAGAEAHNFTAKSTSGEAVNVKGTAIATLFKADTGNNHALRVEGNSIAKDAYCQNNSATLAAVTATDYNRLQNIEGINLGASFGGRIQQAQALRGALRSCTFISIGGIGAEIISTTNNVNADNCNFESQLDSSSGHALRVSSITSGTFTITKCNFTIRNAGANVLNAAAATTVRVALNTHNQVATTPINANVTPVAIGF